MRKWVASIVIGVTLFVGGALPVALGDGSLGWPFIDRTDIPEAVLIALPFENFHRSIAVMRVEQLENYYSEQRAVGQRGR